VLTAAKGGTLGQGVACVLSSVSFLHLHYYSAAKLYLSKFELNL
jgi:hypothetical protein